MSCKLVERRLKNTDAYSGEARTNLADAGKIHDFLLFSSQTRSDAYCALVQNR
jgi:hypothetical protein